MEPRNKECENALEGSLGDGVSALSIGVCNRLGRLKVTEKERAWG